MDGVSVLQVTEYLQLLTPSPAGVKDDDNIEIILKVCLPISPSHLRKFVEKKGPGMPNAAIIFRSLFVLPSKWPERFKNAKIFITEI